MPKDREDEIDLVALARVLWAYKYLIAFVTATCALIAVVFALTTPPIYRADVVVTEVRDEGMGGTSPLMSQLGGLANLAGVNLQADSASRQAKAVLDSRRLAEEFIKRNELLPELFPGSKEPPSLWRAVQQFRGGVLTIREDVRKGTTTLSIEWTDAATAARWANGFIALVNEILRNRAIDESRRNIKYLNDQIGRTNVVELQHVMYSLIENETKKLMFANGRIEYAFTVIDPAVSPEVRARPRRTVIVVLSIVLGLFVGAVAAFAHNALVGQWRSARQPS